MKKITAISIISALVLVLIISWLFFLSEKVAASNLALIDEREEAVVVGRVYLEMEYPELRKNTSRYSYVALFYPDGYWAVTSYDEEEKTSTDMPVVCFRKNGEIISVALQADGLTG